LSIDLAAIMAGSGIRGQFEEKFKALIRDIEEEVRHSVVPFCRDSSITSNRLGRKCYLFY